MVKRLFFLTKGHKTIHNIIYLILLFTHFTPMSSIINKKLRDNDLILSIEYLVDKETYQPWKNKIKHQLLSKVEVPGFRQGKAPEDLLQKYVNKDVLQDTILRETVDRFAPDALQSLQSEINELKRLPLNQTLTVESEGTQETDEGFVLTISIELLPPIDLSSIEKMVVKTPKEDQIPGLIDEERYIQQEMTRFIIGHNSFKDTDEAARTYYQVIADMSGTINGKDEPKLTAQNAELIIGGGTFLPDFEKGITGIKVNEIREFKVKFPKDYFEPSLSGKEAVFAIKPLSVKKPAYTTFEEIMDQNIHEGHNHSFTNKEEFVERLKEQYKSEIKQKQEELRQRDVINKMLETVPPFPLMDKRVEAEVDRIIQVIKNESEKLDLSLAEVFVNSGLPFDAKKPPISDDEVRNAVTTYVRNEFRLQAIWSTIYETKVTNKITQQDIQQASNEIRQYPQSFGVQNPQDSSELQNIAFTTLMKQRAAQWVYSQVSDEKK